MRKFLALVLALVMTMSLVTISAGAEDFTDNSDITYEEAVDVMTAVGVVGGYADGSFNPTAGLTRGAAAKIICNMILGPTTAEALSANDAPYSDVAVDNVFAGYIAYCANEGIISGYADGTFKPAAPLTGYAFMKMLLGALGYDADIEGYTGTNWSIQVAKRALNIGLDDGLVSDFVGAKALTREEACLYAFNTMKANTVDYGQKTAISFGDVTVTTNAEASTNNPGEADYTKGDDNTAGDKTEQFCEKYFSKLTNVLEADAYGRPATKWIYNKETVGKYTDDAVLVYTDAVKGTVLADDLDEAGVAVYATVQGVKTTDIDVYYNGVEGVGYTDYATLQDLLDLNKDFPKTGNGIVVELYANADDVIYRAVTITTYLAEVTDITEDKANTKSVDERALALEYTDANGIKNTVTADEDTAGFDAVYAAVEKGDMVLVTPKGDTTASTYALDVAIPETETGIIGYTSAYSLKLDGVAYEYAKVAETLMAPVVPSEDESIVFFDANGYVVGADAVNDTADKVAVISEFFWTMDKDGKLVEMAKVVYSNGTTDSLLVGDVVNADIVVYEKVKGEYNMDYVPNYQNEDISSGDFAGKAYWVQMPELTTNTKKIRMDEDNVYFADDVKFIYAEAKEDGTNKVAVKEGVQKMAAETWAVVVIDDDAKISAVISMGKASNVSSAEDLLFVAKATGIVRIANEDGDYDFYNAYDAYINGEKVENFYSETEDAYGFYNIEVDEDTGAYVLGENYDDRDEDVKDYFTTIDSALDIENGDVLDGEISIGGAKYADNDTDIATLQNLKDAAKVLDAGNEIVLAVLYDDETGVASYVYVVAVNVAAAD